MYGSVKCAQSKEEKAKRTKPRGHSNEDKAKRTKQRGQSKEDEVKKK